MTPAQLKLIHVAARKLGLADEQYRLLLRNTAGVASAKDLTNRGLEDAMAVMEGMLEDRGISVGQTFLSVAGSTTTGTYWRDKVALRTRGAADARQVWKLQKLALDADINLPGFCIRMTSGRTDRPAQLTAQEAWNIIEALKAIIARGENEPQITPITQIQSVESAESVDLKSEVPVAVADEEVPF